MSGDECDYMSDDFLAKLTKVRQSVSPYLRELVLSESVSEWIH